MAPPDRLPARRPLSLGDQLVFPATPDRQVARAERATNRDLELHRLDILRRGLKAAREIDANHQLVDHVTDKEIEFYERALERVGNSLVAQRLLAERLAVLTTLNNDVLDRFRR